MDYNYICVAVVAVVIVAANWCRIAVVVYDFRFM